MEFFFGAYFVYGVEAEIIHKRNGTWNAGMWFGCVDCSSPYCHKFCLQSVSYFVIVYFDMVKRRRKTASKQQPKATKGGSFGVYVFSSFLFLLRIFWYVSIWIRSVNISSMLISLLRLQRKMFSPSKFHGVSLWTIPFLQVFEKLESFEAKYSCQLCFSIAHSFGLNI